MATDPVYRAGAGEPVGLPSAGAPGRTSEQIRADIERQRNELGNSVEVLRTRVAELTDWRRQVEEHRTQLTVAAGVVGFVVGVRLIARWRRG